MTIKDTRAKTARAEASGGVDDNNATLGPLCLGISGLTENVASMGRKTKAMPFSGIVRISCW